MVSITTDSRNFESNRNYSFDILRIFACFMVIVNHTNSWVFMTYFPSASGHLSLSLFFISKTAVPIFFMISGALLLGKRDTYRIAYGKRAFRIFLDILVFSIISFCITNHGFNGFSFDTIRSMINNPIITPYWYLYSYLGIMLMLPFLQKMVQALNKRDYIILLSLLFISRPFLSFLSYLGLLPAISDFFSRNLFSGEIFYFLLGYFIMNNIPDWSQKKKLNCRIMIACLILFLAGILFCWYRTGLEFYQNGKFTLRLDHIYNLPIFIPSLSLFILTILLFQNVQFHAISSKFIRTVSQATFGVYLTHNIGITLSRPVLQFLCSNMNDWIAVLITDFIIFTCCTIIIYLLRKIPLIKKLL